MIGRETSILMTITMMVVMMTTTMMSWMTSFVCASYDFEEFLVGLNTTTLEEEICQMEIFDGRCPEGHVILVRSALLGRIKIGKCVSTTFGHIGCYTDVLPEMEMYCSGKSTCSVKVDDQSFKRGMPCHKELKNNLWIKYTCVPVVLPSSSCGPIRVTTSGFLSSHVAHKATGGCGGLERPWRLEADDGHQINLTMIDFAYSVSRMVVLEARKNNMTEVGHSSNYPESCRVYAIIREPQTSPADDPLELSRVATICGWSDRVSNVFLSSKNRLEIRLSRSHHVTPTGDGFQPMGGSQPVKAQTPRKQSVQKRHALSSRRRRHDNDLVLMVHKEAGKRMAKRSYDRQLLLLPELQKRTALASVASDAAVVSASSVNGTGSRLFQYTTQPQAEFLFYFKVVGCANPVLKDGMWLRRNRNLLVIGCQDGRYHDTWTLTCVDNTWHGSYGDCSGTGILNISDNVNISSTAIFILGIAILVSIVILIGGIICIRRIHPASSHCQVRCLRDHYGDVVTSGGYGTASTTPSCNKLHVTGSCPSDYSGSGNDYARMRLQQRFNNYPGDYSSMASLMTYEPTRAPTFQTNVASGSIQPLHFGISGDVSCPPEGVVHSPQGPHHHHHHAVIDSNRLRQISNDGRGKFGMSCVNLGQQKGILVTPSNGEGMEGNGAAHQKSVSEPYPLFEGQRSPMVMEHIYESPDTLLLKRKELPRESSAAVDVCGGPASKSAGVLKSPQNSVAISESLAQLPPVKTVLNKTASVTSEAGRDSNNDSL